MPPDQLNSRRLPADFNRQYHTLSGLDTRELLSWVFATHKPFGEVGVVTSFGAESAVLLHLIADVAPAAPVIFIDTGFHFDETLAYRDELAHQLGLRSVRTVRLDPLSEKRSDADRSLHLNDPDACCQLRKVKVLNHALSGFDGWISGQKRYQSHERSRIDRVEWDSARGKWKFNPLADWSTADLLTYQTQQQDACTSVGLRRVICLLAAHRAPTPVMASEDVRAGRWRQHEKLECGLHRPAGLIVATRG
jgi:phosphoadenosine phosphosulfate reductase